MPDYEIRDSAGHVTGYLREHTPGDGDGVWASMPSRSHPPFFSLKDALASTIMCVVLFFIADWVIWRGWALSGISVQPQLPGAATPSGITNLLGLLVIAIGAVLWWAFALMMKEDNGCLTWMISLLLGIPPGIIIISVFGPYLHW